MRPLLHEIQPAHSPESLGERSRKRRGRRLVLGAVALLALVGIVFAAFDAGPEGTVKMSFVRFERSEDGKYAVAVVKVRNDSRRRYEVLVDVYDKTTNLVCFFERSNEDRGLVTVVADRCTLKPGDEATGRVYLQTNGRVGRVATRCQLLPRQLPALFQRVRALWSDQPAPYVQPLWPESDQEIQCPLKRPDGTVEPPRVVPSSGLKRQAHVASEK